MKFRNEIKHEINRYDLTVLRSRLSVVMRRDAHAVNGSYTVHSLYFDTPSDKALLEKINGVNAREKFRIRYYNDDVGHINLEKKSKLNGLCNKQSAPLTVKQTEDILNGDIEWMLQSEYGLIRELYAKMKNTLLQPKTPVIYDRDPFVYPAGNVRVTLDYNIRVGNAVCDFLDPQQMTMPISDAVILEVKWDEFLPQIISRAVALPNRKSGAFSKYAACRMLDF